VTSPYTSPKTLELEDNASKVCCPFCGSENTIHNTSDTPLEDKKLDTLLFIMTHWPYLMTLAAFSVNTIICRDCRKLCRYKARRSWRAIWAFCILGVIVLFVACFIFFGGSG